MKSNFDLYAASYGLTIGPESRFHFPSADFLHGLFFEPESWGFDDGRTYNLAFRVYRHISKTVPEALVLRAALENLGGGNKGTAANLPRLCRRGVAQSVVLRPAVPQ